MYVCACIQTHIFVFWNSFHAVTLYLTAVCLLDHLFQAWNSSRTKHPPSICQGLSVPLYWELLLLLNAVHSCSGSYPLRPVFALHLILHSGQFPPTVSIASTIYSFSPDLGEPLHQHRTAGFLIKAIVGGEGWGQICTKSLVSSFRIAISG